MPAALRRAVACERAGELGGQGDHRHARAESLPARPGRRRRRRARGGGPRPRPGRALEMGPGDGGPGRRGRAAASAHPGQRGLEVRRAGPSERVGHQVVTPWARRARSKAVPLPALGGGHVEARRSRSPAGRRTPGPRTTSGTSPRAGRTSPIRPSLHHHLGVVEHVVSGHHRGGAHHGGGGCSSGEGVDGLVTGVTAAVRYLLGPWPTPSCRSRPTATSPWAWSAWTSPSRVPPCGGCRRRALRQPGRGAPGWLSRRLLRLGHGRGHRHLGPGTKVRSANAELKVSFLAPVRPGGMLTCTSRVIVRRATGGVRGGRAGGPPRVAWWPRPARPTC